MELQKSAHLYLVHPSTLLRLQLAATIQLRTFLFYGTPEEERAATGDGYQSQYLPSEPSSGCDRCGGHAIMLETILGVAPFYKGCRLVSFAVYIDTGMWPHRQLRADQALGRRERLSPSRTTSISPDGGSLSHPPCQYAQGDHQPLEQDEVLASAPDARYLREWRPHGPSLLRFFQTSSSSSKLMSHANFSRALNAKPPTGSRR